MDALDAMERVSRFPGVLFCEVKIVLQGLRIPVIVAVFVGSLGLALLGQQVLYGKQVTSPLIQELEAYEGVASVGVTSDKGRSEVWISLHDGVNLLQVYPEWELLATARLGDDFGGIRIIDRRDEQLSEAYYQLHFGVAEAVMTGGFRELNEEAAQIATAWGLDNYRIDIDSARVYVQLERGDAYLVEIVPRMLQQYEPAERRTVLW